MPLIASAKNFFIRVLFIAIALFSASSNLSAEALYLFDTLTKKNGLSSSVVYDITQDKQGFIWLATEDGLQRYDGLELITYRHSRTDAQSVSNNIIRTLLMDRSGGLWVGTENGLNYYQREFDNFKRIDTQHGLEKTVSNNTIRSLLQTSDGVIWVGTAAGLSSIDPKTHETKTFPHHKVRALIEDNRRQLWVGTLGGGLYLFDRQSEQFVPVHRLEKAGLANKEQPLSVVDLFQDSYGRVFVATWGEGVYILKRDIRKLIPTDYKLPSPFVRSIQQDDSGQVWFGTKRGLYVIEPSEKNARMIQADERNQKSLVNDNITNIFQSQDSTIWIGTYGGGVSRYFPSGKRFSTFGMHPDESEGLIDPVVYAMSENPDGDIWVGSESGRLALFDSFSQKFTHFPLKINDKHSTSVIRSLYQLDDKNLLIGTRDGLYRYQFEQQLLELYSPAADHFLSQSEDIIFIFGDPKGRIWIGIDGKGVRAYQAMTDGQLTPINSLTIESKYPKALAHIGSDVFVYSGYGENIKYLSVTEEQGLAEISELKEIEGTSEYWVMDIGVDWKSRLWIGTQSSGIKVVKDDGKILTLDESNGYPNNSIYAVVPDLSSKKIWTSTNRGITSIHAETLATKTYTAADGLQGNEFNLPGIKSTNGYLYFGGINGFNRFYPNITEYQSLVREPSFLSLRIANKEVKVEASGVLTKSLMLTREVELSYQQTPFSILFTSPQFVDTNNVRFRYRLKGLSDQWITTSNKERRATYTNIRDGDYIFELQAGMADGEWLDAIRTINIRVNPPWWSTTTAKVSYSLIATIILLLIIGVFYLRRKKERQVQHAIKESEERLKLSLWGSGNEFWDWNIASGEISRSNEFKCIQIDCNHLSRNLNELASYVHPEDLRSVRENLNSHLTGDSKLYDMRYRVVDADRGWRWIHDRAKVVGFDSKGEPLRMSGTQRDITDIRLRDAKFDMLGQAFKSTSDGVWIRDHEWRLVECNPAFERMTGFSLKEKSGESLWFPDIQEQPENLMQRIRISIEEKGSWQGEAWAERKNNDPFPQKLSIDTLHDEKGNVRYYVGVFSDITFHKRTEEEFRKLANYDSLTGLPNRACLYDRLVQTTEKSKRTHDRFALYLIDIDNFKRINDSLGHSVGDILIRQVASRLVNCNKEGDTVARIGGDEFVIVMENIKSSTVVAAFSEMLLKELNQPIFIKGQRLELNFSIGVTLAPEDGVVAERLMRNADTAMYEAKKSVDNSYRFYSVEFNERAKKKLALENALRKAIEDQAIEIFYQPKVDLSSGRVSGLEALARWTHKELGFISPDEFIPLAEETGLIVSLGSQILKAAIRQTKDWVEQGKMRGRTSINLSAYQFWNRNLASEIDQILKDEALDARYIELEITESACMQDIGETQQQMKALKELGITMALDDFGTGYSSLAQLKALPFDTLKVDKSFVDNIGTHSQDAKVLKAIIDIANTMEMQVVIEGVETREQSQYLWMNRAYTVQGFYFSKPVRPNLIIALLDKQWHKKEYLNAMAKNVTPLA